MFPSKEHKFIIAFVPALLVLLNLLVFNSTSLLEAKIIVSGFSDTIVCLLSNLGLPKTELYKLAYLFLSEKILYVYCFYFQVQLEVIILQLKTSSVNLNNKSHLVYFILALTCLLFLDVCVLGLLSKNLFKPSFCLVLSFKSTFIYPAHDNFARSAK